MFSGFEQARRAGEKLKKGLKDAKQENEVLQGEMKALQEKLQEARCKNDILEREKREAEEKQGEAEGEKRKAEVDRRKAEDDRREAVKDRREAEAGQRKAAEEMENLRKENEEVSGKLKAYKDGFLSLQPPEAIKDNQVAAQFIDLFEGIACWVNDIYRDRRSLGRRMDIIIEAIEERQGMPLGRHFEFEQMLLAKQHLRSQPLIVRYLIQCHLEDYILGKSGFQCELDDRTLASLEVIEQGMRAQATLLEDMKIRRWRSETLTALWNGEEFQTRQHRAAKNISTDICGKLFHLLPDGGRGCESFHERFYEQVTMPAVELVMSMRLSTARYRIFRGQPPEPVVYLKDIQQCIFKDLLTDETVTRENVGEVGRYGRIGTEKLMIRPGLQRGPEGDGEGLALCKPLILVQLDAPLRPSGRPSSSPD